jgi:hypothetical protein
MYDGSGLTRSTATDLASNAGGAAGCWLVLMAAWSFDLRSTCDFSALGLLRLWRHHPAAPVRLRVRVGVAPRSRAIVWRPRAKPRGKGRGECMDRGDVSCTAHRVSTYERRVAFHPGAKWLAVPRWVTPKGAHAAFSLDFFDARLLPRDIEQSNLPRSPARLHSTARRGERNRNVVGLSRAVCRVTTEADRAGDTRTGGCAAGRQPPRW